MKTSKFSKNGYDTVIGCWPLFQELPESYLLCQANDPVFTVVETNKAREQMTKVPRAHAVGRPLFEVYPLLYNGKNPAQAALRKAVQTGKTQTVDGLRYPFPDTPGHAAERYWRSTYIPLRGADSTITHILATTKDITMEQIAKLRTHEAEARLREALTIGKVGSWLWDLKSDYMIADPFMARMFGVNKKQAAQGLPLKTFQGSVHPDDRDRVMQAVNQAIAHKSSFESEYRLVRGGKVRWVLARGKVEEQQDSLLFPGVIVDITERRDLQAQIELAHQQDVLNRQAAKLLQERNEELEAISRTKDEFVALASHQLRTPATAVKQYLGMVLQGYVGEVSDIQMEMLGKAFESNERQIEIINQILNAARVDTGRLMLAYMPDDLTSLVRGIAADMQRHLEQHSHAFKVMMPPTPVMVAADHGYLRMAIENILDNACLYTPEGGSITVKLRVKGNYGVLTITDTGVGIKKADLPKLFVKFSRIHNPLSVQAGGSGIGLYLASEIIKLHGGNISVESKIGKGTTFAISLPLVQNEVKSGTEVLVSTEQQHVRNITNMRTGLQTQTQNSLQ